MIENIDIYDCSSGENLLVGSAWFNGFGSSLRTTFTYSNEWISNPSCYALSPDLPLTQSSSTFIGLPLFLKDCSPDRWGRTLIQSELHRAYLLEGKVTPSLDDRDYLVRVADNTRIGSLRLYDPSTNTYIAEDSNIPRVVDIATLRYAANQVEKGAEKLSELKTLLEAGSGSLGGARPKAQVLEGNDLWLAKFPGINDTRDVIGWEYIALSIASKSVIRAPQTSLFSLGDEHILLEKRFDRSEQTRIPYMSAMTLLGAQEGAKLDYSDIADGLERVSSNPEQDIKDLFKRMVLSVAIHNTDDHLRNHALLRQGRGWSLSPVYDINPNPNLNEDRVTSIYGYTNGEEEKGLYLFAQDFKLENEYVRQTVSDIKTAIKYSKSEISRHIPNALERREIETVLQAGELKLNNLLNELSSSTPAVQVGITLSSAFIDPKRGNLYLGDPRAADQVSTRLSMPLVELIARLTYSDDMTIEKSLGEDYVKQYGYPVEKQLSTDYPLIEADTAHLDKLRDTAIKLDQNPNPIPVAPGHYYIPPEQIHPQLGLGSHDLGSWGR